MGRKVWIIAKKDQVEQSDLDDAKANNCPEIANGIPPALQYIVHDFDLPCAYEEPELPPPEPPRNPLAEIDAHKGDASAHHAKTTSASELTSGVLPSIDRLPALTTGKIWQGNANKPAEANPLSIPSGMIAMWHGIIATIPTGWVICDGNNSTPNLLAKFIEGVASVATNPGATGGAKLKNLNIGSKWGAGGATVSVVVTSAGGKFVTTQLEGEYGYHVYSKISDIRPPYYDIAFIMKT